MEGGVKSKRETESVPLKRVTADRNFICPSGKMTEDLVH